MSSVTPQQSDSNHPQPRLVISSHDTCICRLAYLPDGRRVVTGSDNGTVKVWNLENGEQEGTSMGHAKDIYGFAVTRDGTKIVCGDNDGSITVWNVKSHKIVKKWTHPDGLPEIAISPDDRLVAVGDEILAFYTMKGRQVNHSIEVGNSLHSMSFSPDGKKLACGMGDGRICVYSVDSGTLALGPLWGHQDSVRCVLWSRDGSRLFSSSDDETIRCWNTDTGEQIGRSWTGHANCIQGLSLSPDGSILASASLDTVRFWEVTTGNLIGQHLQHDIRVEDVPFSPSGEFVVSVRGDGNIYLWRVPLLNSIKHQVITSLRCPSVLT
jgi:WD40 repeat protein